MGAHVRLRIRIATIVLAGALLVALGVGLLLRNTYQQRDGSVATVGSDTYLLDVVNVERLVVDVETGLRGYVITGRPLFLQPLRIALSKLPRATGMLERSAAEQRAFQPQVRALLAASRAYLSGYVPRVLRLARRRPAAARSAAVTFEGKQQLDVIRAQAAALERLVSARESARQRAAHHSAEESITEAIVVLVLLTLLTAALGGYLGHLAVQRDRARQRSQETVEALQQSILPAVIPEIPECELAIRFEPAGAGELVGGDFYDVFAIGPRSWGLVVGDVCGKGPAAAAVTAMARWILRTTASTATTSVDVLRQVNEMMVNQPLHGRFITVTYMRLTLADGSATVDVACAGHPPPVLRRATGEPVALGAGGDVLGVWPRVHLRSTEVTLSPGDSLVAYTDGVTDQGPETRLSPAQVLGERPPDADAGQLADALTGLAHEPPGPHRDDIAIVALRFLG